MADYLLTILRRAQKKHGYLSEEILKKISTTTGIPISRVYGVATFYSMLHTEPVGTTLPNQARPCAKARQGSSPRGGPLCACAECNLPAPLRALLPPPVQTPSGAPASAPRVAPAPTPPPHADTGGAKGTKRAPLAAQINASSERALAKCG